MNGSQIMVLGLAYKANVDDMRESPAFHLFELLSAQGAKVAYYDPHIPVIGPTREHKKWQGLESVQWNEQSIRTFDVVVICTAHAGVNYSQLAQWCDCIVDTRNAMKNVALRQGQVWKA